MFIDYSPVRSGETKMLEFSRRFTPVDLRAETSALYNAVHDIIKDMTDAQITHIPYDPHANDTHAVAGEENIGWSLAHLVLHVTASAEEGAAFGSLLARGIPAGGRLRYEPDWKTYTTKAQVIERLEESRRIVLAYLDAWPNQPHLDVLRDLSPRYIEKVGQMNATATHLSSLMHMDEHLDQFREAARQARETTEAVATGD